MKRLGAVVMVVAFAATGCTTRKGGTTGVFVGMGMVLGGGVTLGIDRREGNMFPTGPQFLAAIAILTGSITAGLSAIVAAGTPDPKDLPPPPPPLPEAYVQRTAQLQQMKRVASRLAKDGHCDQVRELDLQVATLDPNFHATKFRDDAIARCVGPNGSAGGPAIEGQIAPIGTQP